jgi:CHAT domain-containing protein
MNATQLAAHLVEADPTQRELLVRECDAADAGPLARALKDIYQDSNAGDPRRAAAAASCLEVLARRMPHPEVAALAAWTRGMASVHLDGLMEQGLALLDEAAESFSQLQRPMEVAATQVSMLQALAILGRYREAVACGLEARATFRRGGDLLAAGKIEQNLGNIAYRRGQLKKAESWYRSARRAYVRVDSQPHLAQIDNNLGMVLSDEHRFAEAAAAFEQALERAQRAGLEVTQTEVQYNLGCLAMFRGQYDRALERLELARVTYDRLRMPHRAARVELELADAYLELNLAPEAASMASRVASIFAELGMRAELARAVGCHGRAASRLGQIDEARTLLGRASELYSAESNRVDAAFITLVEAQLLYSQGEFEAAVAAASRAEPAFVASHMWGRLLQARWLRGEAWRMIGRPEARSDLESVLEDARNRQLPQIAHRCLTSLGLLAASEGDASRAQGAFEESASIIESLRAPLPADDFRLAFLADKLTSFTELARVSLAGDSPGRAAQALDYVERARSRALVDMLTGVVTVRSKSHDAYESDLLQQLHKLREELQWFYSQINRPEGAAGRDPKALEHLYAAVRAREAEVLEVRRRIEQHGGAVPDRVAHLDIPHLQKQLGSEVALVEYFSLDDNLMAFVVTDQQVAVVERIAVESEVEVAVGQLRSQIDSLRLGGKSVARHMAQLVARTDHHLQRLYNMLIAPLEPYLGNRRLVVVPHRALHYVPFHALHDGKQYLVQRRSVSYVPSATVLSHCLERPVSGMQRPVLVGVADERAPRVRDEVTDIARLLPNATVRLDSEATIAEVRRLAAEADLLHLACHGQFRRDNPRFSALHLADGWMTVGDAYELDLHCGLVILSACETGVNALAPGEEIVGLARGFFSAGTPSLMLSLWTVDDNSTAELMRVVYEQLRAGLGPADALAEAQRQLLRRYPHPYYWSAFFVLGRW